MKFPAALDALTLKVKFPATVGVPEIVAVFPELVNVSPVGIAPAVTAKVNGPIPVTVIVEV